MVSNKQRRQAAQRHLQRQLERRAAQQRARRRNLLIGSTVAAVVVVVGAALLITNLGGDDDSSSTASSSSPAATSAPAAPTPGPGAERAGQTTAAGSCTYTYDAQGSSGTFAVDAPSGDLPTGTQAETIATSAGAIGITLDYSGLGACAADSFSTLASQGYFDGTVCHRLTTSPGLEVLQCGDPSGTGAGGPGYSFPTAVSGTETYPRGTLAMANSGQGTDGSQFFLVYGDSLQGNPNYTVFGTVDEAGLGVLDQIAAAGTADGSQDGAPSTPVTITGVTPS
ncbi:peptidyl-prolyl cis-trans isomerase B (cyclophilin B) [Klenkia marina]|uniref:Peptidyl-prolyl cis-trans isomerase B (Cyclophilin B) n=1 Tax=Klenkia marina TaxID=1960309 RepID=A0A1G4YBC6_9ACTN|nr:peptidylprolyl isomerase [Klenkia marina]SCX50724.1 peptidyl-prolyl cis-trans isomerase B (cyclophilin B) [Klenkia marina]